MKAQHLKSLGADLLYYGIGNLLYTFIQLISMPIIVRHMSMGEVTNWNILLPTGALLSAIVTFGMDSALVRFVLGKEEFEKKIIFSTGLYFVMTLALTTSFVLWMWTSSAVKFINISQNYMTSYWMLLIWLPGIILSQFFQNWFKFTFQRSKFLSVIALQSSIYLILILYLKYSNQIILPNVMRISLISIWVPAILGVFFARKMFSLNLDKEILKSMLSYGVPFMLLAFGFNLIFSLDKYILVRHIVQEEFAIYSQAFRIAAVFSMVISSFNFAFGPFSLSIMGKDEAPALLADLRTYYLFAMSFAGLIFIAISKLMILFLSGQNYILGYKFVPFFVMGYIFYGLYSFEQLGIIYSKKSHLSLYALLIGLSITIGTDFLLVKSFAGNGTALGFVFGMLAMVLSANFFSKKYLTINSNILKDFILIAIFILCGLTHLNFIFFNNFYIEGIIKVGIVLVIFATLSLSSLFHSERYALQKLASNQILKLKNTFR